MGNISKCTLLIVPEYISLTDSARMISDSVYTQKDLTESKALSVNIDSKWSAGNYEVRLLANNNPVAKCSLHVDDATSKYGVPTDIKFANSYISTDPENIYISELAISCIKSNQVKALDDDSSVSYEFRIRANGGEWSKPIRVKEKQVSYSEDGQNVKIAVLNMSKFKNGTEDIIDNKNLADINAVLSDIIDVTKPIPGKYDYGRLYIDTTKHNVEIQLRYFSDNEDCHWSTPIGIGAGL